MLDLAKTSGLKLSFEDDKLSLGKGIVSLPVSVRKAEEIRDYLKDRRAAIDLTEVYLVYRGVCLKEDQSLFKRNHLRYDITVILPGFLGKEFTKTVGHHHPTKKFEIRNSKFEISYPEIYEVLYGTAYFFFQRINEKSDDAPENYLIMAGAGEKVIVPPGFGHITINPTSEPLLVADIFADNVESVYEYLKNHHGGAYYITKSKIPAGRQGRKNPCLAGRQAYLSGRQACLSGRQEKSKFEAPKNQNYKNIGPLNIGVPLEISKFNLAFQKSLYSIFKDNPQNLEFLTSPEKYKELLIPVKLFGF
jgi:glucose-6-phosphate isomerase